MKFNLKKVSIFLVFLIILAFSSSYMVKKDYKVNEEYIGKIFSKDVGIHKKYGNIESYHLRKTGNYSGDSQEDPYYYYTFYIKGSIKDGVVELKIYKDKKDYVVKYIK